MFRHIFGNGNSLHVGTTHAAKGKTLYSTGTVFVNWVIKNSCTMCITFSTAMLQYMRITKITPKHRIEMTGT